MQLRIYKLTQKMCKGWDTYSDAIVVADLSSEAKLIHPNGEHVWRGHWIGRDGEDCYCDAGEWPTPHDVTAELVGVARDGLAEGTVLCASYHAG